MALVRITCEDHEWHAPFFQLMEEVFGLSGFRDWGALCGWSGDYVVHGWEENGRLVASLGETRMVLTGSDGRAFDALQFGAVATAKEARGRGLARYLIENVLNVADRSNLAVLLFANPSVIDFYPKFGFRRVPCQRLWIDQPHGSRSQALPGKILDPQSLNDRKMVEILIAKSNAAGGLLLAKRSMGTILWHWLNSNLTAVYLQEFDSIAFIELTENDLFLADCLGGEEAEDAVVKALVGVRPAIEFGFVPTSKALLERLTQAADKDCYMFWLGPRLPNELMRFPALMMT